MFGSLSLCLSWSQPLALPKWLNPVDMPFGMWIDSGGPKEGCNRCKPGLIPNILTDISVTVSVNSRFIERIIAVFASKSRTVFRSRQKLSKKRDGSRIGSLLTSSRPPGRPQKRSDDRTSNAGAAVRTADGSRRTTDAADEQCLRSGCSSRSCTVVDPRERGSSWVTSPGPFY